MRAHVVAFAVLAALLAASGCLDGGEEDDFGHDEESDYDEVADDGKADGVPATFDQNLVLPDTRFLNDGEVTTAEVQAFFERSPYGTRSWLADYRTPSGKTAAQVIAQVASAEGIHPVTLIARMQVETSLVSRTTRPTQHRIDRALGCGCPDNRPCNAAYRGFENQVKCGADIMRKWYDASVAGTGHWRRGVSRRTLDPRTVTPRNHATASLYAYTPWVLPNRGGNWLVWNVTRRFFRHAIERGWQPSA